MLLVTFLVAVAAAMQEVGATTAEVAQDCKLDTATSCTNVAPKEALPTHCVANQPITDNVGSKILYEDHFTRVWNFTLLPGAVGPMHVSQCRFTN